MKKNLWKLLLVSSFCAVGLGLNNGEKVNAMQQNHLGNGAGAVEKTVEYSCANKKLISAAFVNDSENIKLSLEEGADIDVKDSLFNQTPLIWVTYHNNFDMVKFLVENGADVNARDKEDRTAFIIAYEKGNWKIFYFLLENGRRVNDKDKEGRTALMSDFEEKNSGRIFERFSCDVQRAVIDYEFKPHPTPLMDIVDGEYKPISTSSMDD